jgi:hypothetical protein
MCSRSAPAQANVTNETTGWLCCNIVINIVLDGADHMAGNDVLVVYLFFPLFLPNCPSFWRHVDLCYNL